MTRLDVRGYSRSVLLNDSRLRRGDHATLMAICLCANAFTGETHAKASTLGRLAKLTPGALRRCIDRLEQFGYLEVTRREGRTSLLRLPAGPAEVIHTPRSSARGNGEEPRALGRVPRALGRGDPAHQGADIEQSRNSQETLPTIHVSNGFAAAADDTGEFELPPEIYARIGHHLPKARPKGTAS